MGAIHDLWRVAICLLVIPAVALIFQLTREHHSGGDPGGRIMAVLKLAEGAVPSGAKITYQNDDGPHWQRCYGDGADGWSDAGLEVQFASSKPSQEIVDSASRALARRSYSGYRVHRNESGTTASWSGVPGLAVASVILTNNNPDGYWTLSASAPPVGSRFECGGG